MKGLVGLILLGSSLFAGCGSSVRGGIELDHRIGLVSFGESKDDVANALGGSVLSPLGGGIRFYPKAAVHVGYLPDPSRAVGIITRSARYKTASGIGVGSTLAQLKKSVHVLCGSDSPSTAHCVTRGVGDPIADPEAPYTLFTIDATTHRVTEIEILAHGP
jgi:hypothetical protein